jgi:hypothetical protein
MTTERSGVLPSTYAKSEPRFVLQGKSCPLVLPGHAGRNANGRPPWWEGARPLVRWC